MKSTIRPALVLFVLFTVICSGIYPYLITAVGQLFFQRQANGSLLTRQGNVIGSSLIGQAFSSPRYFWSRPSATSPKPYDATASTGSNLGPLNPAQLQAVKDRVLALRQAHQEQKAVPVDLVTASASGLDPHISIAAAYYQAPRIAHERQLTLRQVKKLIDRNSQSRFLGIWGEPYVNVLELNLALDQLR